MAIFKGRPAKIVGTGKYIPEKVMWNKDFEKFLDTNDAWITERTGIKKRHFVSEGEKCSDLAYHAAVDALSDAKMSPEEIDMVIVATNSPDCFFPAVSCKVQGRLGAIKAGAYDVLTGCAGSLAAMQTAAAGIACGIWNNVLVIGSESFGKNINWQDRGTCILFGDGAGACVMTAAEEGESRVVSSLLFSEGDKHHYITLEGENEKDPLYMRMKGQEVFKYVNLALPKLIKSLCDEVGLLPAEVDFWVLHQANTRIIDGVFRRVGISMEKTLLNLEEYGNTSSASMMIVLDEAMKKGCIKRGDKVAFVAFGAGMTLGALLYEA